MKRPDGVTLIAVYHFFSGALGLLGGCAILFFAILPVVFAVDDPVGLFWSLLALGLALLASLGAGVISLAVGWGLLELKSWARWGAIVLAILGLFAVPIGTIIGALIIFYLLQDQARIAFEGR